MIWLGDFGVMEEGKCNIIVVKRGAGFVFEDGCNAFLWIINLGFSTRFLFCYIVFLVEFCVGWGGGSEFSGVSIILSSGETRERRGVELLLFILHTSTSCFPPLYAAFSATSLSRGFGAHDFRSNLYFI